MSLYGVTKGTDLEKDIEHIMHLEENGVSTYYAIARIAAEKGLNDLADELRKIAADEAEHAGLYAMMNGVVSDDIFSLLSRMAEGETAGEKAIEGFAQRVREAGLEDAAQAIRAAGVDEGRHGTRLKELIEKYS